MGSTLPSNTGYAIWEYYQQHVNSLTLVIIHAKILPWYLVLLGIEGWECMNVNVPYSFISVKMGLGLRQTQSGYES